MSAYRAFRSILQGGPKRRLIFGQTDLRLRAGVVASVFSVASTLGFYQTYSPVLETHLKGQRPEHVFNHMSTFYDEMMDQEESAHIQDLRYRLLRQAEGEVLELAVGTGRNFRYYPEGEQVKSVVAVDVSEGMLEQAKKKLDAPELADLKEKFTFMKVDAEKLPFEDDSFDTVLETMGLCSYEDPLAALKEMARVSRPGARILLFEHGISSNPFLAAWQRFRREPHLQKYGCDYAKDIPGLLNASGLKVRHLWTSDYDTLVFCIAYKDFDESQVFKAIPDPNKALPKDLKPEDFY